MSLIKKLAGETAIYGLSSILGRVINWVILTPFFTRVFSTGEYGIVNDLYFYIAILLVFFVYRMETAFFRFASKKPIITPSAPKLVVPNVLDIDDSPPEKRADEIFTTASISILVSTLILGSLLWFAAPTLAEWLKYPGQEWYVRIGLLIIGFDALSAIPFARLRLESRPIRFALIKLLNIFLYVSFVYFFLEACPWLMEKGWDLSAIYDADNRILYVFIANLVASVFSFLLLLPLYRGLIFSFAASLWRQMMRYSMPLVIASFAGIINSLAGTSLLKYWGTGTLAENLALGGLYAAAAKLAVLMSLFIQAFNYAAEPFFFRQAAVSDDKTIYADVARAFALVGSFAFLGIMLYLDVIQYFLGNDFREGLVILPLLLVANFFLGLFYNFSMAYKLTDRTHLGGYIAVFGTVITVLVNFFLIAPLGYYAPAIASFCCFFVMAILGYWVTRKFWPVDYPLTRMAAYLVFAVALWGLSLYIETLFPQLAIRLIINTLLLSIYLGTLYKTENSWLKKLGIGF